MTCFKQNALEQLLGLSLAPLGAGRRPEALAHCGSQSLPRDSLKGPVEGLGDFFPVQENSSGIRKITSFSFLRTVFFPHQPPAAQASGSALARTRQLLQAVALLCSLRTGKGLSVASAVLPGKGTSSTSGPTFAPAALAAALGKCVICSELLVMAAVRDRQGWRRQRDTAGYVWLELRQSHAVTNLSICAKSNSFR